MVDETIDISNYTYSIKFLLEQNILSGNTNDIQEYIDGRKDHDIALISKEINEYSHELIDVYALAKKKDKFYSYRQKLIQRKQLILDDQAYMVRNNTVNKKNEVISYKVGANADGYKPTNDYERRSFIDSNLAGFQVILDTLENHITFLMESIKNISDMIYGFQYVIALEEYRKNY